ncbi:MAG: response regulator transcription factor, partial [Cyanobacteria bacterium HKST-UBA02]|nr:response regulator transcription factor [Cyanobacteria bacterium HKST-UBA02]
MDQETIRIMLVEDHEIMRFGLKKSLELYENFEIVGEAGSGTEAVKKAFSLKPAIILMDIGLPELDGIEATRQIKLAQPQTRVLMLTSFDQPEKIFASLAAGADGYCVKSIQREELAKVVELVSSGCAFLDPVIAGYVVKVYDIDGDQDEDDDHSGVEIIDEGRIDLEAERSNLTRRELQILKLIVNGDRDEEMAARLEVAVSTV